MTQPSGAPAIPGLITPTGAVPATYTAPADGNNISGTPAPAPDPVPVPAEPAVVDATPPPVPAPPVVPPPAAPAPTAPAPADTDGYPADTPLEQMTPEQQVAYWRAHTRRWETLAKQRQDFDKYKAAADELAQLKAANATDTEKAVAAARQAGYAEASAAAAVVLVNAHVRAALNARLAPDRVDALASHLDHKHFLGADGISVDAEKVAAFTNAVAPAPATPGAAAPAVTAPAAQAPPAPPAPLQPGTGLPRALPDLGQGTGTPARPNGLAAGAAIAAEMFGNPQRP